jgi:hypothetical protein
MPKCFSIGRKIGTKMMMISVHSSGQLCISQARSSLNLRRDTGTTHGRGTTNRAGALGLNEISGYITGNKT